MTLSCGLFFARNFTMIMYPAGASAWGFLDRNLPAVPEGTLLRFIIRQPLSERLAGEDLIIDRLATQNPDRLAEIRTHVRDNPIEADEKSINVVFRDMFEIEYDRLVAQNGQQRYSVAGTYILGRKTCVGINHGDLPPFPTRWEASVLLYATILWSEDMSLE